MTFFDHKELDLMDKIVYSYRLSQEGETELESTSNVGISKILFRIDSGKHTGIVFSINDLDENKLESEGVLSFTPILYKTEDEELNSLILSNGEELQRSIIWVVDDFFASMLNYYIESADKGK